MGQTLGNRNFVFHKPYPVAREADVVEVPVHLSRDPQKSYLALPAAVRGLEEMASAARKDGVHIVVISSYRRKDEQAELFRKGEERHGKGRAILWLAPPGYSEHHTGYVFDLADRDRPETDDELPFEGTAAFRWLERSAARFGFEMSFPKHNWQGVGYEPWHWRFAGDAESRALFHPNPAVNAAKVAQSIINGFFQRMA